MQVLIVDDASFMRKVLKDLVEASGHEVVGEARNGDEAIKAYDMLNPDLVLMDVVMPEKSGLEAVKHIISTDPDALIVVVSATGREEIVKDAVTLGAKGFIKKPPDEETFRMVLKKVAEAAAQRGDKPALNKAATFMLQEIYRYANRYFGPITGSTFETKIREFASREGNLDLGEGLILRVKAEDDDAAFKLVGRLLNKMLEILSQQIGDAQASELVREALKMGHQDAGTDILARDGMPDWVREEHESIERATIQARKDLLATKYGLKGGKVYVVSEPKPEESFIIFRALMDSGSTGMCITRRSPVEVGDMYGIKKAEMVWLTFNEVKEFSCVEPTNTSMIFNKISRFLGENPSGTIILDGFEYIMTHNNFTTAHKFINAVHDEAMMSKGLVIVPLDIEVLENKQAKLVERSLDVIKTEKSG